MSGTALVKDLISATGLPEEDLQRELTRLLSGAGLKKEELTLDELRILLAEYLQEVLIDAKNEFSV